VLIMEQRRNRRVRWMHLCAPDMGVN